MSVTSFCHILFCWHVRLYLFLSRLISTICCLFVASSNLIDWLSIGYHFLRGKIERRWQKYITVNNWLFYSYLSLKVKFYVKLKIDGFLPIISYICTAFVPCAVQNFLCIPTSDRGSSHLNKGEQPWTTLDNDFRWNIGTMLCLLQFLLPKVCKNWRK